jgi:hypothetical protein
MKDNKHVQAIPQDVLTQAQTKSNEVSALLAPYVVALTPAERYELPKVGEKTISFVEKAYDFAQQNPNLVLPYLDMAAFGTDFGDAYGLWTLVSSIRQLDENTSDTEMAAGSEAYQAALVFYKSVKMAAAQDIPGGKRKTSEIETETVRPDFGSWGEDVGSRRLEIGTQRGCLISLKGEFLIIFCAYEYKITASIVRVLNFYTKNHKIHTYWTAPRKTRCRISERENRVF